MALLVIISSRLGAMLAMASKSNWSVLVASRFCWLWWIRSLFVFDQGSSAEEEREADHAGCEQEQRCKLGSVPHRLHLRARTGSLSTTKPETQANISRSHISQTRESQCERQVDSQCTHDTWNARSRQLTPPDLARDPLVRRISDELSGRPDASPSGCGDAPGWCQTRHRSTQTTRYYR